MCRNIKKLRRSGAVPTDQELHDAALQFVRKISGFHAPSQANAEAFDAAVRDVALAGRALFNSLRTREPRGLGEPGSPQALPRARAPRGAAV
jgi:hypothetical protein